MLLCMVLFSSVIALPDVTHLPDVHRQSVLCAKRIVAQYFEQQYPTAITYPRDSYKNKYTRALKIPSDRDILISDIIIKEFTYELFRDAAVWYVEYHDALRLFEPGLPMHFIMVLSDYDGDIYKVFQEFYSMILLFLQRNNLGHKPKLIVILPKIIVIKRENVLNIFFKLVSVFKIYNMVII